MSAPSTARAGRAADPAAAVTGVTSATRLLTVRGAVARRGRLATSFLAVVVASGFVTAAIGFATSTFAHYQRVADTESAGVAAVLKAGGDTLPVDTVDTLAALPEVGSAVGDVVGLLGLSVGNGGTGSVSTGDGEGAVFGTPPVARVWSDGPTGQPYRLDSGAAPVSAADVVLDVATAERRGIDIGDTVTIKQAFDLDSTGVDVMVTGTVTVGGEPGPPVGSVLLMTADTARQVAFPPFLTQDGTDLSGWTDIRLTMADGVSATQLAAAVEAALPGVTAEYGFDTSGPATAFGGRYPQQFDQGGQPTSLGFDETVTGAYLVPGEEVRRQARQAIENVAGSFIGLVVVVSLASVLVGAFVIGNTFSILVAQRSRELALLRALGAMRRFVRRSVLLEAFGIGVLASLFGVASGWLALQALAGGYRSLGLALPLSAGATIPWWVLMVGFALGVGTTVFASRTAGRRASRVPPIAALRDIATTNRPLARWRIVLGVIVLGGAVALAVVSDPVGDPRLLGVALLVIIATGLLQSAVVALALALVDRPLSATGPTGLLAARNTRRNTARASSTATALIIGVGLVAFVATLTASIAASTPDGTDDPQARLAVTTLYLMLVVAVFISAIGVANTLGLSILERIREIGLLRAVGALRAQIRGSIRSEAIVLTLVGTLIGEVSGAAAGYFFLAGSVEDDGVFTLAVPWLLLVGITVGGLVVGVLTAVLPARRASNLQVLDALVTT